MPLEHWPTAMQARQVYHSHKRRVVRQGGKSGRGPKDRKQRGVETQGLRPADEILYGTTKRGNTAIPRDSRLVMRDPKCRKQHPQACRSAGLLTRLEEMRYDHRSFIIPVVSWSAKAVARSGLRMMPTSPPPPLRFRTVGFPQYGSKASLSEGAFPSGGRVKLAPRIPRQALGLLPPSRTPRLRDPPGLRCLAPRGNPEGSSPQDAPLTPGVLGSGPSCAVSGHRRLLLTPSVRLAGAGRFHGVAAYTPRLRCAGAPRRPTRRSLLSLPCCPGVPRTLRRWVRRPFPLSWGVRYQAASR